MSGLECCRTGGCVGVGGSREGKMFKGEIWVRLGAVDAVELKMMAFRGSRC